MRMSVAFMSLLPRDCQHMLMDAVLLPASGIVNTD